MWESAPKGHKKIIIFQIINTTHYILHVTHHKIIQNKKMYIVISTCIYCMYQLINQSQWFVKHQKKLWAQDLHEHVHVVYERNM